MKKEKKEVKKEEVRHNEKRLPLQIDSYNDIFSDFDPRPFEHRALSIDFLDESKRAVRELGEGIELRFFIPQNKRNLKQEGLIKKRLWEHFKKHHDLILKEKKSIIKRGLSFVAAGFILMIIATYFLFTYEKNLIGSFFVILLEPASWFLFWEGLNLTIFESRKLKGDLDFYKKMSHCKIEFVNH